MSSLAQPVVVLGLAVVVDHTARRIARIPDHRLGSTSLTVAAVDANAIVVGVAVLAAAAVAVSGRRRLGLRWSELEHGGQLRLVAGLAAGLLTWRYGTTGYDFLSGQWHLVDRLLLLGAAVAALFRPLALLPLVVLIRVVQAPFLAPFGFFPGQNIDQLLVLVLTVLGAAALWAVLTGRTGSAPVLTLLVGLVAAHFFVPGWTKLGFRWHANDELANMPLNGYAQGWLGGGDGGFARRLSDVFDTLSVPLRVATVALELGAPLAVLRRRLAAAWLCGCVAFHVAVTAALGFSFLEWVVIEVALVALLLRPANRRWAAAAFRPGPVVVALAVVLLGGRLFEPPRLAWIDGPLVYAYEFDGVDTQGRRWGLVSADFEPYDQAFAFGALPLGPRPPLAAGYGAIDDGRRGELAAVDTLDELAALERAEAGRSPIPEADRAEAVWVLERFLDRTYRDRSVGDRLPEPPRHFWTDRPGPRYDHRSPLVRLEVNRVTTLRADKRTEVRREPVLVLDGVPGSRSVHWADPVDEMATDRPGS